MQNDRTNTQTDTLANPQRRQGMKILLAGSLGMASITSSQSAKASNNCIHDYNQTVDYQGLHQAGVITPDTKEAIFVAFNITVTQKIQLQKLLQIISQRIAYLTRP